MRFVMIEMRVGQAQLKLANILDKVVVLTDEKKQTKKAVILPYDLYKNMLSYHHKNITKNHDTFKKFVGILDNNYLTDDDKYLQIIK
jgi:hypothetical protein